MPTPWYKWLNPLHYKNTEYYPGHFLAGITNAYAVGLPIVLAILFILWIFPSILARAILVAALAMYVSNARSFILSRTDGK